MFRKPQPVQPVQKVRQYTPHLYGSTPPICIAVLSWLLSLEEMESQHYTSHLYGSTPPICTAVLLEKYWGLGSPERSRPSANAVNSSKPFHSSMWNECYTSERLGLSPSTVASPNWFQEWFRKEAHPFPIALPTVLGDNLRLSPSTVGSSNWFQEYQQDINGEKLTIKEWWIFGADLFHGLRRAFHGL